MSVEKIVWEIISLRTNNRDQGKYNASTTQECKRENNYFSRSSAFSKYVLIHIMQLYTYVCILDCMCAMAEIRNENLGPQSLAFPVKVLSPIEGLMDANMVKDISMLAMHPMTIFFQDDKVCRRFHLFL